MNGFLSWEISGNRKQLVCTIILENTDLQKTHSDVFLSAWCKTSGFGVELIVSVDDDSFPSVSVEPLVGYKQCGVSGRFIAMTTHEVKFTFQANLGPAHIGDVVLHIVGFTEKNCECFKELNLFAYNFYCSYAN